MPLSRLESSTRIYIYNVCWEHGRARLFCTLTKLSSDIVFNRVSQTLNYVTLQFQSASTLAYGAEKYSGKTASHTKPVSSVLI